MTHRGRDTGATRRSGGLTLALAFALACAVAACGNKVSEPPPSEPNEPSEPSEPSEPPPANDASGGPDAATPPPSGLADVTAVTVSGEPGAYRMSVTIASPDTGCEGYADWWEVVSADGDLLYRRILAHSHVDEQPFTRSGGPIAVSDADEVIVRAHFAPGGYEGSAMRGSVADGFRAAPELEDTFARELENAAPQPDGCAF